MATNCSEVQALARFQVLCPTRLPHAGDGTVPQTFSFSLDKPEKTPADWVYVGASYGVPVDPTHWELNRPRWFLHFVILEGSLSDKLLELAPGPYRQRDLGARTLGGRRGRLYRQRSYAVCGCGFGGHYTFVWQENGVTYAASLHRWDSAEATLALLGRLIEGLAPAT